MGQTQKPVRITNALIANAFVRWWYKIGKTLDPDTDDVSWFDKRKDLCEYAFVAGYRLAEAESQFSRKAAHTHAHTQKRHVPEKSRTIPCGDGGDSDLGRARAVERVADSPVVMTVDPKPTKDVSRVIECRHIEAWMAQEALLPHSAEVAMAMATMFSRLDVLLEVMSMQPGSGNYAPWLKKAGHHGGLARAAKLSPARKSEIARKAANARWHDGPKRKINK